MLKSGWATGLSFRVSVELLPLGVVGASFFIVEKKWIDMLLVTPPSAQDVGQIAKESVIWYSLWRLPPSGPWGCYIWGGRGAWLGKQEGAETFQTAASPLPAGRTRRGEETKSQWVNIVWETWLTLLSMLMCSEGQGGESLSDSKALSSDWEMSNSSAGKGGAWRSDWDKL